MQTPSPFSNASAPIGPGRKIYVFEGCTDRLFLTDPAADKTYDLPVLRGVEIGPYLEDLQVRVYGVNFTTNFQYKVVAGYSNDGGNTWTPFSSNVLGNTGSAGNVNSPAYSTRTDFGTLIRLQVVVSNKVGGGVVESGTLSITLSVKLWT